MTEARERNSRNQQIIQQFRANGGRNVGSYQDGLLLLTTVGAKSGQTRVNPLAYTRDGDRYVVAASHGGSDRAPDWFHNLVAHPNVTVEVGSDRFAARARVAQGEERDHLYAAHAARFPAFLEYQQRTSRVIQVVLLERA